MYLWWNTLQAQGGAIAEFLTDSVEGSPPDGRGAGGQEQGQAGGQGAGEGAGREEGEVRPGGEKGLPQAETLGQEHLQEERGRGRGNIDTVL